MGSEKENGLGEFLLSIAVFYSPLPVRHVFVCSGKPPSPLPFSWERNDAPRAGWKLRNSRHGSLQIPQERHCSGELAFRLTPEVTSYLGKPLPTFREYINVTVSLAKFLPIKKKKEKEKP